MTKQPQPLTRRTAKTLLTTVVLTASAAALAAPAHAAGRTDRHWTATGTALCAGELLLPAVKSMAPVPLDESAPSCGKDSLIKKRH